MVTGDVLVGAGVIDDDVQIVGQKIGTLEAVSKGKIPLESVGGAGGLARGCGGLRFARPVEIGLNIVERADFRVRSNDHRFAALEP